MKDKHDREIKYLRVSVTDRCNLRCQYCMPEDGVRLIPHEEILRYDEILRVVRIMAGLGVSRVRLTGGEPLVRRNIDRLAADIARVPGVGFLGLTTNGLLLPGQAPALYRAGVRGVNISIDSTNPARYALFTRRNSLQQALAGLRAALAQPFHTVKVNCVLSPQSLPADWLGVVELARALPVDVRLIEWMPMAGEPAAGAVTMEGAMAALEGAFGPLQKQQKKTEGGPAAYWRIAGFAGRVGFIPAMSACFCQSCNRVRLTAAGDLKLCLFYDEGVALKPLLRGGAADAEIEQAILDAVARKPERHHGQRRGAETEGGAHKLIDHPCGMSGIGG